MTEENKQHVVEADEAVEAKAQEAPEAPEQEEVKDPSLFGPNGEELLFPDGPPVSQVEGWKSQYGEIFLSEIGEDVFIWRTLKRLEYKTLKKNKSADEMYMEERIAETCVIYPEGYDFNQMAGGLAGTPSTLANYIIQKSGFESQTAALRL